MEKPLRVVAAVGPAVVLLSDLLSMDGIVPRQDYSIVVGLLIFAAIGLLLFVTLRPEFLEVLKQPNLLVPLGLVISANAALAWVIQLPPFAELFALSYDLTLMSMSFSLSTVLLIQMAFAVAYAAWTLNLILLSTEGEEASLEKSLNMMRQVFFRTLGYMALSVVFFFAMLGMMIGVSSKSMTIALIGIGASTLLVNFCTAGVLLRGVARPEGPFLACLQEGVSVSLRRARLWWFPLVAQMEILGFVTYINLSYSAPGGYRSVVNFSVNGLWTGGFENSSRWLSSVMGAADAPSLRYMTTLLLIALGVLAIVVKMRIARVMHHAGELSVGPKDRAAEDSIPADELDRIPIGGYLPDTFCGTTTPGGINSPRDNRPSDDGDE